jgi:hypothetical protein
MSCDGLGCISETPSILKNCSTTTRDRPGHSGSPGRLPEILEKALADWVAEFRKVARRILRTRPDMLSAPGM